MVFPLGCGSSLGLGVSDGPVGSEYSTCVQLGSRGSCHILPSGITLTLALSHRRERGHDAPPCPPPGIDSRLGASSVGGRFAYSRLSGAGMIRLRRTGSPRVREAGEGRGVTVGGRPRRIDSAGPPPARPFDGAQGERPLPRDRFTPRSVGGRFAYSRLSGAGMIRLRRRTGSPRVGEGFVD